MAQTNSRFERLKPYMEEAILDVVVVVSPENTLYFSSAYIQTQTDIRDRLAMVVLPIGKDPVMIACSIEKETVCDETWVSDKRFYTEFLHSPISFLVDALKEKGFEKATIGIELDYLMAHYYLELIKAMPNAKFVKCTRLLDKVRMIKEPKEIEILTNAANRTREALEYGLTHCHPGDTELKLENLVKIHMLNDGCSSFPFFAIGTAAKSILVHKNADNSVFKDGDISRLDFGGRFNNYYSDFARTILVGNADSRFVDIGLRYCDCYYKTIDKMKPGVMASELFHYCKDLFTKANLPFTAPHIGHSLGLIVHEFPMVSPKEDFALEENMIFNIEPVSVLDGRMYHMEDLIQITPTGYKVLSEPVFNPRFLSLK